jgi:hypothetical protein
MKLNSSVQFELIGSTMTDRLLKQSASATFDPKSALNLCNDHCGGACFRLRQIVGVAILAAVTAAP